MAEPENFILVLLREIRAEMNARFDRVDHQFHSVDTRFDAVNEQFVRLEKKIDSVRQAAFGESVLARYTVAEVEEQLEDIRKRLGRLENKIG